MDRSEENGGGKKKLFKVKYHFPVETSADIKVLFKVNLTEMQTVFRNNRNGKQEVKSLKLF